MISVNTQRGDNLCVSILISSCMCYTADVKLINWTAGSNEKKRPPENIFLNYAGRYYMTRKGGKWWNSKWARRWSARCDVNKSPDFYIRNHKTTAVIHVYDLWINITGTRLRITHRINMFCNICLRVAAAVIQLRANNTLFKWFVLVFTGFVCFFKEWNDLFAVMTAVELNNLNNATVWRTDGVKAAASHTEYVRISPHGGLGSIHQKLVFSLPRHQHMQMVWRCQS